MLYVSTAYTFKHKNLVLCKQQTIFQFGGNFFRNPKICGKSEIMWQFSKPKIVGNNRSTKTSEN